MATRKCKDCGNQVSTHAKQCPHCGAPVKRNSGCGFIVALVLGIIIVSSIMSDKTSPSSTPSPTTLAQPTKPKHDTVSAYTMCQKFVKDQLKAPRTAKWPWVHTDDVTTHLGGGKYRIESYVDSQNAFGALIRTKFTCVVQHAGEDKWRLESLEFHE